jgi:hypothetical protein
MAAFELEIADGPAFAVWALLTPKSSAQMIMRTDVNSFTIASYGDSPIFPQTLGRRTRCLVS